MWSSVTADGRSFPITLTLEDITAETFKQMLADCARFQRENAERFEYETADVTASKVSFSGGKAFWLSRNVTTHKVLYSNRNAWEGWHYRDALQRAAEAFGSFTLVLGADGKVTHTTADNTPVHYRITNAPQQASDWGSASKGTPENF
jgi:hypothetical protein